MTLSFNFPAVPVAKSMVKTEEMAWTEGKRSLALLEGSR